MSKMYVKEDYVIERDWTIEEIMKKSLVSIEFGNGKPVNYINGDQQNLTKVEYTARINALEV